LNLCHCFESLPLIRSIGNWHIRENFLPQKTQRLRKGTPRDNAIVSASSASSLSGFCGKILYQYFHVAI
jgi:hypothetical protein